MRLCWNEEVEVYETHGSKLDQLLIQAAGVVRAKEKVGFCKNIDIDSDDDGLYTVTVYIHLF